MWFPLHLPSWNSALKSAIVRNKVFDRRREVPWRGWQHILRSKWTETLSTMLIKTQPIKPSRAGSAVEKRPGHCTGNYSSEPTLERGQCNHSRPGSKDAACEGCPCSPLLPTSPGGSAQTLCWARSSSLIPRNAAFISWSVIISATF